MVLWHVLMDGGREDAEIPVEEEYEEEGNGSDGRDLDYCPDLFDKGARWMVSILFFLAQDVARSCQGGRNRRHRTSDGDHERPGRRGGYSLGTYNSACHDVKEMELSGCDSTSPAPGI